MDKKTVACELFLQSETMVLKIPVEQFADFIPKRFIGFSDEGEELFEHFCPFCYEQEIPIADFGNQFAPAQGAMAVFCLRCNTRFKLFQKRSKNKTSDGG